MKKGVEWVWMIELVLPLIVFWTSSVYGLEVRDISSKFHPYFSVSEEYTNNVNLTATNKKSEYITHVNAGFKFSALSEKTYGVDLDVSAGYVYYARDQRKDYFSPSGTLNAWYQVAQPLRFRVTDYFIRSDEAREQDYSPQASEGQYLLSTERGQAIYIRNVFSPSIEYQFGKENSFSFHYRNNFYENKSRRYEDSRENFLQPRLIYWFNVRHGVSFEYGLTLGDFEHSPDFMGHNATGRYTYRFNPKTSLFTEYTQQWRDFENPSNDYIIYRPTVGINHAFSPTLSGSLQAGYYWKNEKRGPDSQGPFYQLSLSQQVHHTTYGISFQGGYTEDYFTAENLGFSKYYRGLGNIRHQFMPRVTAGILGSFEWAKYDGRKDRIWNLSANGAYQILNWLSASVNYSYRKNHSNFDLAEYVEHRGKISLAANF